MPHFKQPLSPAAVKAKHDATEQAKTQATLAEIESILGMWHDGVITGIEADNKLVMLLLGKQS